MNYAIYILLGQAANIQKEIEMLQTNGKGMIKNIPEFARLEIDELDIVISQLEEKKKSLIDAYSIIESHNIK